MTGSIIDLYTTSDAMVLAAHVRAGDLSAPELAEAAIAVIEELNPNLNAVASNLYDMGRKAAKSVDRAAPLARVPFLLKELATNWQGAPVTNASCFLKDIKCSADSAATRRIKAAGLVMPGKSNAPENGWNIATEPVICGPTISLWNADFTPGGSGGGAVAIATGMVPLAEASDGAGSIRIPASNCGIIGLKPTRGRVSLSPFADYLAGGAYFLCVSRTMRDTATYLDALSGSLPGEACPVNQPAAPFDTQTLRTPEKPRIGFTVTPPNGRDIHPDVKTVVKVTAQTSAAPGHEVIEHDLALDAAALWRTHTDMTCVETAGMFNHMETVLGRPVMSDVAEPVTWAIIQRGRATMATDHAGRIEVLRQAGRAIVQDVWPYDVFITPTLTHPSRPVGFYDMSMTDLDACNALWSDADFAFPFNISGQPAMAVPLGTSAAGLSAGVQLVARPAAKATLPVLGTRLEQAMPWRNRRPMLARIG